MTQTRIPRAQLDTTLGITTNPQSTGYTLLASDINKIVSLTGTAAQTFAFTAAATLGSGWFCYIQNNSTAALTLDPNASELIDSLTSYIMYPNEVRLVQCSGTAFTTIILTPFSMVWASAGSFTFMRPPGYNWFDNELISGGGSGSARATTGNTAGGSGGAWGQFLMPASAYVAIGSTETVIVGASVTGVTGNTSGNQGNTSSVTVNGVTYSVLAGTGATTAALGSATTGGAVGSFLLTNYTFTPTTEASTGAACNASNVPAQSGTINGSRAPGAGGAVSSTAGGVRTGGLSSGAGAGGAAGLNTGGNGTGGSAPGGGGGGAVQGGTSGGGAAGQVTVRGIC